MANVLCFSPYRNDAAEDKTLTNLISIHKQNSASTITSPIPTQQKSLSCEAINGAHSLCFGTVHKLWSSIRLDALDRSSLSHSKTTVDFVVVIDHSASMKTNNKLAFVQATIQYMLSKLDQCHRFCLIKFNQETSFVTNGLLPMTPDNKELVLNLLHEIKPQGTTNISDALLTAIGLLNSREDKSRISSIMLFTDGLSNAGLRGRSFTDSLKESIIPAGLTINTFGYGMDHDSKMLQNISFASKGGVYYYIETVPSIPATFGECLAGILSTVAHNIEVKLLANDGCRIVNFYTKFPVKEIKSVKEYDISLGSMYSQETRSILFKLSLRNLDKELAVHNLVQIIVSYTNTLTGLEESVTCPIRVSRPSVALEEPIPIELDKQINRFTAAAAIEEAIRRASSKDYNGAQKQLLEVIDIVQNSASAKHPSSKGYCDDLVEDLKDCADGMESYESFSYGIHYAHAYSTMYYMERSTGSANLAGVKKISTVTQEPLLNQLTESQRKHHRNNGYGYVTYAQEEEAERAVKQTAVFVTGYLDGVL